MTARRTVDIAIVGAGPKGFGCLERLAVELGRHPDPPQLRVTLHDPAGHPGAGPVYDPGQPDHLLMNVTARHVDVWSRDVPGRRAGMWPDLLAWLAVHHPGWADADAYVPRRLVGAYLQAAFAQLLAILPASLTVQQVPGVVTGVQRCGSRWRIHHGDPACDRVVDEVMVTTGHGTWRSGDGMGPSAQGTWPLGDGRVEWPRGRTTMIGSPFPVDTRLGIDRIPPGATVAVRGFALSAIDVMLTLTVGRGGRFEGIGPGAPAAVGYHASGAEPACIVPFGRTGLPLLAKPGPALVARADAMPRVWERLRERIRDTTGGPLLPGLCHALADAAQAALLPSMPPLAALLPSIPRPSVPRPSCTEASRDVRPVIEALLQPPGVSRPADGSNSLAAMRRSVQVATGQQPPDAAWAIGEAWRRGYPALVARVGHGHLDAAERPAFDALAVRLERLAFGPPAANLQRILGLVDTGLVDLRHLRSPALSTAGAGLTLVTGRQHTPVDVLVDAVIGPPGITFTTPVWGQLLRAGLVRVTTGTRGVAVTDEATCLDAWGTPVPGLAAVGRATEGCVLGNDTLSRTLHDGSHRWAARIVAGTGHDGAHGSGVCRYGRRPPTMTNPGEQMTDARTTSSPPATAGPAHARTAAPTAAELRAHCQGTPPLEASLEPWQVALCGRPAQLRELVDTHGSPLNLHDTGPFDRNVARLQTVAATRRVELEILFARKADKALAYVDRARALGIGVDTASEEELAQVLANGVDPARVVITAAIKTEALIRLAIRAGVTIVLDNDDELDRVMSLADAADRQVPITLRFGGFHLDGVAATTRFGFEVARGHQLGARLAEPFGRRTVRLEGVHFHLDGYDVAHRIAGVAELLPVVDGLRAQGHAIRHLDVGGGLPMSYVDDAAQWTSFRSELRRALLGERPPITYANHGLGLVAHEGRVLGSLALYPVHQRPTAPDWLETLLDARVDASAGSSPDTGPDLSPGTSTATPPGTGSIAAELRARGLTLRCEPGRSLLDGCGLTVARVEHRRRHADGSWSVGVAMNRTQCSTAKADHAVDPLLVPTGASADRTGPIEGHLMGAYCTESDLLTWRRLRFPSGVARGDLIVFPNTAGYLMHFVESRSHRFPLALNVVHEQRADAFVLDAIDEPAATAR